MTTSGPGADRPGSEPPSWERPPAGPGAGAGPAGPAWAPPPGDAGGGWTGGWQGGGQGAPAGGGAGPQGAPYGAPGYGPPAHGGWGPPGYGPPPGWAPGPQQTETKAVVALVLAVGSFVVCPFVPAVIALVLASSSARTIAASGGRLTGTGLVKASRIVAWINLALCVLAVLAFVLLVAVAGQASFSVDTSTGVPS